MRNDSCLNIRIRALDQGQEPNLWVDKFSKCRCEVRGFICGLRIKFVKFFRLCKFKYFLSPKSTDYFMYRPYLNSEKAIKKFSMNI